MEDIKVSVLVTFYNQKEYVNRALNSIFSQIVDFNFEVLIGDDCSDDGTSDILKSWVERFPEIVSVYTFEEHRKSSDPGWYRASENRLNLLKHVKGEYFIYLDGDDYFCDDKKLQMQVDILDNPDNQDCIACGHKIDMEFLDGTRKPMGGGMSGDGKCTPKDYWARYYFHTDSLLIRSHIKKYLDIDILKHEFNDNFITYMVIQFGSLYYIDRTMAIYLQTQTGIWTEGPGSVKNSIRNIFLYEICLQINPKMRKETFRRCSTAWIKMYNNRQNINSSELDAYKREADLCNLKYSQLWMEYNKLVWFQKIKLLIPVLEAKIRQKTGVW